MLTKIAHGSLKLRSAIFVAVAIGGTYLIGSASVNRNMAYAQASAGASSPGGLQNEQELRKKEQRKFVREHSGPSGKVSPDAYVKGMEHVQQMKVAPYIGAKPVGEPATSSKSTTNK